MTAYYNEHDQFAAAWLRNLIAAGHIAPGDVDERSIEDVCPDELAGYVQCHFFAGIGVWSHALRMAGWEDNRAIWTGSCPCQPFSQAGKGAGFDDERHLWPAFNWLIQQCEPAIIVGEQVASKDGLAWLDLVRADMEGTSRAFAAADLCAAGFGAPHIRQRSFWVAYSADKRHERHGAARGGRAGFAHHSAIGWVADSYIPRLERRSGMPECVNQRIAGTSSLVDGLEHADSHKSPQITGDTGKMCGVQTTQCQSENSAAIPVRGSFSYIPDPTNGFWTDVDWLGCRDDKWRPVEPGTFPLAHGATNRVGRLRGYGNAIVAPVAQGFIEAVMACIP